MPNVPLQVKTYINEDVYQLFLHKLTEYWSYNLQNAKLIWCPNVSLI